MAVTSLIFLAILSTIPSFHGVHAAVDSLYCGEENCYEVLGVESDVPRTDIVKAYRKLAKKWHPDMHRTQEKKAEGTEMFQKIANAYEILRDEESRTDYNYMLDHPDEFYYNYYRYYKRRTAPKVDVRLVIAITISVISVVQYYGAWSNYTTAINYLCKEQKYRIKAINLAKEEGLLPVAKKKDSGRRNKEEMKEEEESIIKKVIEENLDIRGGYSKPTYTDVLWVQLVFFPYYLLLYIHWYISWIWKFTIRRQEYGIEEKLYIIRRNLKLNTSQFDALEEAEKEKYLHKELWIKEKFRAIPESEDPYETARYELAHLDLHCLKLLSLNRPMVLKALKHARKVWKELQDEEMKSKLAESARYKSYRRYMKKGGPGQMSFGPE